MINRYPLSPGRHCASAVRPLDHCISQFLPRQGEARGRVLSQVLYAYTGKVAQMQVVRFGV